jgi:hypothetical protein
MSRSLPMQIASLRHCVAAARQGDVDDRIIEDAEAGIKSLEWLERNPEIIREVRRLYLEHPAILAILSEFPGSLVTIT